MQPDAVTVQQSFQFLRFLLFPAISMTQRDDDREREIGRTCEKVREREREKVREIDRHVDRQIKRMK